MRPALTIRAFLNQYQQKLKLSFSSGEIGLDREIKLSRQAADTFDAADYFNVIRTSSIAVVGYQESRYIGRLDDDAQAALFNTLFQAPVCAIICNLGNLLPGAMIKLCEQPKIPVLQSALSDSELLDKTRDILGMEFPEVTLPVAHGRNLAVLVEAAARNHLLQISGYNSAQDFIQR